MEEAIQETARKVAHLQKLADSMKDGLQRSLFQSSLQNTRQVLANLKEMEHIFREGV